MATYHCRELTKGSDGMDLDFHLLALLERGTTAAIDDEGRRWNHDVAAHLEEHESCESARPASHAHLLSDFK